MQRIMMRLFLMAVLFFSMAVSAQATEIYNFDPMHTYVLWHVNHFGFSDQAGKFTMVDGTITLDESKPQDSKVNVTIHTDDIATGIPKLDEHLKSGDFFNVTKYPTATFVSNKVQVTCKDTGKVYGLLTLVGVTRPVVLEVKLLKMGMHPMKNKKSLGFSATTMIKRSDFGMKAYLPAVGDDVQIEIGAEANLAG